ncbi:D12 class N6 adenine-specific DNA methyltransferase family protein [Rickettsia endosymbiont of Ixodes pacificus]|nr:DNA adenine methylase [Rickettsia endosymbiont of Ixodes pacificus]KJW02665.1 D12 class N6 adenine-specific DNA methyltransferase family protein [Rickettsia endosymbiont of Ixodes pacificus]
MSVNNLEKPGPFLQWVGGKRKIASQLVKFIPSGLNNYYEPFLGGGALFFQVRDRFKQCFLSDINLELVTPIMLLKRIQSRSVNC